MSNDFDIREYLREHPIIPVVKRKLPAIDLSLFDTDREDRPPFRVTREGPQWRLPPVAYTPPGSVMIQRVRTIPASYLPPAFRMQNMANTVRKAVTVHKVRPFSRKSRTSSYWEDNGWKRSDNSLLGYYRACGDDYKGLVELVDSDYEPYEFYIYDPPGELLHGRHGACFHRRDAHHLNKYWIHFSNRPQDVDSGIIQVQKDLTEALSN